VGDCIGGKGETEGGAGTEEKKKLEQACAAKHGKWGPGTKIKLERTNACPFRLRGPRASAQKIESNWPTCGECYAQAATKEPPARLGNKANQKT